MPSCLASTALRFYAHTQPLRSGERRHCVGQEAREIFATFDLKEKEQDDPETTIKYFDSYFLPQTNISVERHKFNNRV